MVQGECSLCAGIPRTPDHLRGDLLETNLHHPLVVGFQNGAFNSLWGAEINADLVQESACSLL